MRGVIIHAPKDLRIEETPDAVLGPNDVRVRIRMGGICGSDLHYYNHGGTGFIRLKEPMALGHEVAGVVSEVGSGVSHLAVGARVAVNPSRHCGHCQYCEEGLTNHCLDMRFFGSAMRFPHVQGAFRESLVVDAAQALPVADSVSMEEASMAEPLAVCLHAVSRAGSLVGKRVLLIGCGPIGNLVIVAARNAGAEEIIATDVQNFALDLARRCDADETLNVGEAPEGLKNYVAATRKLDVIFEASGNAAALKAAVESLRPRGLVVQVGLGSEMALPTNIIVTREIEVRGTFRFTSEFALAVDLMNRGRVNVKPLVTAKVPFVEARSAFEIAGDRARSAKVLLDFG
jgi:L-idonate 5-dehydrogenase